MSEQEISRPKIFVFCNGGSTGWYEGAAIAEGRNVACWSYLLFPCMGAS